MGDGCTVAVVLFERAGDDYALITFRREAAPATALTAAEKVIARLILLGMSARAIAAERRVSVHTVRNQVRSIYGKLGAHSRAELARACT